MSSKKNLSGKIFGELTVICETDARKNGSLTWLCKCSCGQETVVRADSLKATSKGIKSCGCKRYPFRKPYGEAARRNLYTRYKNRSAKRGYTFNLTLKEFAELTSSKCHYCRGIPKTVYSKDFYGEYIYNGIDRVDNDKGYETENCVPCCSICNRAKGTLTYKKFVEWIEQLQNSIINLT